MKRLLCLLLSLLLVSLSLVSCDGNDADTDKGDSTQQGGSGLPVGEDPVKDDLPWDELN